MAHWIEIKCTGCGHIWHVDVEKLRAEGRRTIWRDGKEIRVEEYIITCPRDGTVNVIEVEVRDHE